MQTVLPPELERKRVQIATIHNWLVVGLLAAVFAAWFLLLAVAASFSVRPIALAAGLGLVLPCAGYGVYRVFQYDKVLCRRLDFICPHCHQPLYEPRSFINLNGLCPKCRQSILD